MDIKINGRTIDITLENEKTVGDVLAGLDTWLADSGFCLSGIEIDNVPIAASSFDEAFSRELSSINALDIKTSAITELNIQCLANLLSDINDYKETPAEKTGNFYEEWKNSAQAVFAREQIPDIYSLFSSLFSGSMDAGTFVTIIEERIREINDLVSELDSIKELIEDISVRLIDFPLDIQTGKDAHAAATMQIFSGLAEKTLRIFKNLKMQGFINNQSNNQISELINSFNNAVNGLFMAYEANDTVLAGDFSEYEVAPKFKELYYRIKESIKT